MILDTSAVVAIFLEEPGFEALEDAIAATEFVGIGTPTLTESAIVLASRLARDPRPTLRGFLHEFGLAEVAFGELHWRAATEAFLRFGKGRHPAGLNYGDCMSYATARVASQPLLFVGDDFRRTDIEAAL